MTVDLYAWKAPRGLDLVAARALIADWQAAGADPRGGPFEASPDLGWFHRELVHDQPNLETTSDTVPTRSSGPIWLATEPETPARLVVMHVPTDAPREVMDAIVGLAAKYDVVLFDPRTGMLRQPFDELAAWASATFWPRGAIQAVTAGGVGTAMAAVAWFVGAPIVSGVLIVVGAFLVVMAAYTFVHEGRKALRAGPRRSRPGR